MPHTLEESAKKIMDANYKAKQAGDDPMPKSKAKVTDIGDAPTYIKGEELPKATNGVPTAKAPGKTANPNSDKFGVGSSIPKDANTIADTDFQQYGEASPEALMNRKASSLPSQTFKSNPGAITFNGKTDISSMFEGAEVSEEFIEKLTTMFEAYVAEAVAEQVAMIEEEMNEAFDAMVEQTQAELFEQHEEYLNYIANELIENNQPAFEHNVRTELAESFMQTVINALIEHNVQIPDDQIDIVEGLTDEIAELQAKNAELSEAYEELQEQLVENACTEIVEGVCDGLTETQAERLAMIAENISFDSLDEYANKLETIKENHILAPETQYVQQASLDQMLTEDASFEYVEEEKDEKEEKPMSSTMANRVSMLNAMASVN